MSLVRLGPFLCETDETHTFSPRSIFPKGSACLHLVAPVHNPDDLTEVSFSGNVDCVRVEGAPCVDHGAGQLWTGVTGEPPQFVVTSLEPNPPTSFQPAYAREEIKRLSARHLFMQCADLVGQTFMPPAINSEDRRAALAQMLAAKAGAEPADPKAWLKDADPRRVFGADVLKPAAVRLAGVATQSQAKERQRLIAKEMAMQLAREPVTEFARKRSAGKKSGKGQGTALVDDAHRPYLASASFGDLPHEDSDADASQADQDAGSNDEHEAAGSPQDPQLRGMREMLDGWEGRRWARGAKRNLTPTEECFFAASERQVKCHIGLSEHFPSRAEMAATGAEGEAMVSVRPVPASANDVAADKAIARRGVHYALYVGAQSGRHIAASRRAHHQLATARRPAEGRGSKTRSSGFLECLREGGRTPKEAARHWASLSAELKAVYRERAERRAASAGADS